MNTYQRFLITFTVAAALLGCMQKTVVPPPAGEFADKPSIPPLEALSPGSRPAPVFGPPQAYAGSPLDQVGRRSLFGVHSPTFNQIALLKNGDESFAARVHLLEKAETSIRIQALIFWGDESGLHIAEILKRKKTEGIDVRVIVDAAANLGWQTQWMYFDLKQHGIEVQGYESLYLEWINEIPIPFLSPAKDPEAPNHRYHEKMWIVDGETDRGAAVVGGLNIANEYFRVDPSDPSRFWRDQDIIVKGSIVADMVTAFDRNFEHFLKIKESRGALNTDLYWQSTREFLDEFGKLTVSYTTRLRSGRTSKNHGPDETSLKLRKCAQQVFSQPSPVGRVLYSAGLSEVVRQCRARDYHLQRLLYPFSRLYRCGQRCSKSGCPRDYPHKQPRNKRFA